jgi:hypothetical protein
MTFLGTDYFLGATTASMGWLAGMLVWFWWTKP